MKSIYSIPSRDYCGSFTTANCMLLLVSVLVKKSGHKKYLFFDLFFKSGHESYFLRGLLFQKKTLAIFFAKFRF